MKLKRNLFYLGLPVLGFIFCLWYIKSAACNVVYTDYIRLVNSYLPDVWNPAKFFVPDILTRMPVNYLARIINVVFFHYNTVFDMTLGVLGLGISGVVLGIYSRQKKLGAGWFLILMVVVYSLNKWEMLTNGSGWVHFMAFACFYFHYLVLDRTVSGEGKRYDGIVLMVLPFLTTLGVAGPYCAVYTAVLLLVYAVILISGYRKTEKWDRRYVNYLICLILPFLLYLWSNLYAVSDHADAVTAPFLPTLLHNPVFFVKLLVKSFSTMVLGEEVMMGAGELALSDPVIYLIGIFVIAAYVLALWMNVRFHLYRETILPIICLLAGVMNHGLIMMSRWIFLKENYAMSSRYALQFQIGIIGIILTAGLLWNRISWLWLKGAALICCLIFLAGNCVTTKREIRMAPYREEYMENIAKIALNFEEESDDVLRETFDYRKSRPDSGEKVRAALTILKENRWNVFQTEDHK